MEHEMQKEYKYKKCPFCCEEILEDALKCKHCKSDLSRIKLNEYNEYVKVCPCCYSENKLDSVRCETCKESLVIISEDPEHNKDDEYKIKKEPEEAQTVQQKEEPEEDHTFAIILINFFIPGLGSTIFNKKLSKVLVVYLAWVCIALLLSIFTVGCFFLIWMALEIIVRVVLIFFLFELF